MVVNGLSDLTSFQGKIVCFEGADGWSGDIGYLDERISCGRFKIVLFFFPIKETNSRGNEKPILLEDKGLQNRKIEVREPTAIELLGFKIAFEDGTCTILDHSPQQSLELLENSKRKAKL